MDETELLPCPFCGEGALLHIHNGNVYVQCHICGASTVWYKETDVLDGKTAKELAVESWNMRV